MHFVPFEPQHQRQAFERVLVVVGDQDVATHRRRPGSSRWSRLRRVARDRLAREQRQSHREFAALVEPVAGGADLAAVQFDQRAHQREADAQAAAGVDALARNLREQLEDARHGFGGDADAAVAHADLGAAVVRARGCSTMRPPSPVYLAALCSRLPTTCARRTGSPRTQSVGIRGFDLAGAASSVRAAAARSPPPRRRCPPRSRARRPARSCRARCATRRAGRRPGGSCA